MSPVPCRGSIEDTEAEQFYSLPPTRRTSSRVSIVPDQPSDSDLSIKSVFNSTQHTVDDEPHRTLTPIWTSHKIKLALPYQYELEQHRLCAKPILKQLMTTNTAPSRSTDDMLGYFRKRLAFNEEPIPSPAGTITRSISVGSFSRVTTSGNPALACIDDPEIMLRGIEDIVVNIQVYLNKLRHDDCPSKSNMTQCSQEEKQNCRGSNTGSTRSDYGTLGGIPQYFLVSTMDVAGILDIVIAGLRQIHGCHTTSDYSSTSSAKDENIKPITRANSIVPPPPTLAEPATTVSLVHPSFSVPQIDYCPWDGITMTDNEIIEDRSADIPTHMNTLYQGGIDACVEFLSPLLHPDDQEQKLKFIHCWQNRSNITSSKATWKTLETTICASPHERSSAQLPQTPILSSNEPTLAKLRRFDFVPLEDKLPGSRRHSNEAFHTKPLDEIALRVQRKRSCQAILEGILAQAGSASKKNTHRLNNSSTFLTSLSQMASRQSTH